MENIFNNIVAFIKPLYSIMYFYMGWITLHYMSAQFYMYYCAPQSIWGFFMSPFLSVAPHCNAMRWVIYESGTIIYGMWVSIGTWLLANVLTYKGN